MRLGLGVLLAAPLGLAALLALSFAGWGPESEPVAQLARDKGWLLTGWLAGVAAGALLAWAVAGTRRSLLVLGATLGSLPATAMVSAYFTQRY